MYIHIYIYIYIDKSGLEVLITFHEAEFEITDGYYLDEGRYHKINSVIKHLHGSRLKFKNGLKSRTGCYQITDE